MLKNEAQHYLNAQADGGMIHISGGGSPIFLVGSCGLLCLTESMIQTSKISISIEKGCRGALFLGCIFSGRTLYFLLKVDWSQGEESARVHLKDDLFLPTSEKKFQIYDYGTPGGFINVILGDEIFSSNMKCDRKRARFIPINTILAWLNNEITDEDLVTKAEKIVTKKNIIENLMQKLDNPDFFDKDGLAEVKDGLAEVLVKDIAAQKGGMVELARKLNEKFNEYSSTLQGILDRRGKALVQAEENLAGTKKAIRVCKDNLEIALSGFNDATIFTRRFELRRLLEVLTDSLNTFEVLGK